MSLFHTNWLPAPGDIAQNTLQSHSKQCRDYNGKREHDKHMINYFSFFTLLSFINSCLLNWQDITFVGLFKLRWTLQYVFFSSPQAIQHRKHFSIFIHAQIYFQRLTLNSGNHWTVQYLWHNDHCYYCALFTRLPSFRSQDRDERLFMSLCTVKFSHKHNLPKYSHKINMDNKKDSSKCVK